MLLPAWETLRFELTSGECRALLLELTNRERLQATKALEVVQFQPYATVRPHVGLLELPA